MTDAPKAQQFLPLPTSSDVNINVTFLIGEGSNLQECLDDLMIKVGKNLETTNGYNPQALFPVEIKDDGGSYYAIQQWKWITNVNEQ